MRVHMNDKTIDYGWTSSDSPLSCGYISPRILTSIAGLGARRVLDLGSGNGRLCSELAHAGYDVVGVEYDQGGVDISYSSYPHVPFHNYGVQDDPQELLAREKPFDVVISTEVIEHLYSPHLLPHYARSVLKDAGHLIVTTPYHGYWKNLALSLTDHWDKHHTAL